MDEVWKKVPLDYLPDHIEVSNLGRVRSLPHLINSTVRKPRLEGLRYHKIMDNGVVTLSKVDGRGCNIPVGKLVLLAFKGAPEQASHARLINFRLKEYPYQVNNLYWKAVRCKLDQAREKALNLSVTHV